MGFIKVKLSLKNAGLGGALLTVMAIATVFAWSSRNVASGVTLNSVPGYKQDERKPNQKPSSIPANSWKTLVPLRSTRADVERLFGKPHEVLGSTPLYKFSEENVVFTYARGNCDPYDGGWNVPAQTIIEIKIIPQGAMPLGKAGLDLSKYRRTETQHPPAITYTNAEEGVTITTRMFTAPEDILSIQLRPSVRELEFACPAKPPN